MQRSHRAFTMTCIFGMALIASTASAQTSNVHDHEHPDVVVAGGASSNAGSWPLQPSARAVSAPSGATGHISTTADNQILVELTPEDTTAANLFDLNGRTLVFTPDGHGSYSRSVQSVAWEDNIGEPVADRAEIPLQSFMFDFAGQRWDSFFVSRRGALTFAEPFVDVDPWDHTMLEIVTSGFVTTPTISPLYKPYLGGADDRFGATQHVEHHSDRVVVTWKTSEAEFTRKGGATFQVVLHAGGSIRFNYLDVTFGDGVVGLFPDEPVTKVALIASIPDEVDDELPGYLDLTEAAIYESSAASIIAEFSVRGSMPEPDDGTWYSYRLHFDADPPYFEGDWDLDRVWQINVEPGGIRGINGRVLPREARNRIALDVGPVSEFSGMVRVGAAEFRGNRWTSGDGVEPTSIDLPAVEPPETDLSRSDSRASNWHSEVFYWRSMADIGAVACRIVEVLGDEFDLFSFHSEFRVDIQWDGMDWTKYGGNVRVEGLGIERAGRDVPPCAAKRLKGVWSFPYWMHNGLGSQALFAHEFTHAWTAFLTYDRNGQREGLFDAGCMCHWRWDLHLPAAFPWREGSSAASLMGGTFWRDNGDGTWTPLDDFHGGGHAWLDLYAMGLANAREVPDMFILRNLKPVRANEPWGPHTGAKEIVTIEQVIAAEGRRRPSAAESQRDFNAGLVYLLEPGQTPDPDLLRLHAEYRAKVIDHWSHVTGGRSRMTTTVPGVPNRSPAAVGTLAELTLHVGGTPAVVDVADAFRDPDGDPLTYRAASSAPAVATAVIAGSRATLTPVSVGMTTVTVTASDTGGSSATQRFAVSVTAPSTFTDHPIRPGTTPIRAVHFRELRERIAALRRRWSLPAVGWTDPILTAGVTPVRLVHLLELRSALAEAYARAGRTAPRWSDTAPAADTTPIRAVHLMELRAAVVELE